MKKIEIFKKKITKMDDVKNKIEKFYKNFLKIQGYKFKK